MHGSFAGSGHLIQINIRSRPGNMMQLKQGISGPMFMMNTTAGFGQISRRVLTRAICAIALSAFTTAALAQPCCHALNVEARGPLDRVSLQADSEYSANGNGPEDCRQILGDNSIAPDVAAPVASRFQFPSPPDTATAPQVFHASRFSPETVPVAASLHPRLLPLYLRTSRLLI